MTTQESVIAEARALLGVRFAHQGRHPQHGLDCLGFLLVVAERDAAMLKAKLDQCCHRRKKPGALHTGAWVGSARRR